MCSTGNISNPITYFFNENSLYNPLNIALLNLEIQFTCAISIQFELKAINLYDSELRYRVEQDFARNLWNIR